MIPNAWQLLLRVRSRLYGGIGGVGMDDCRVMMMMLMMMMMMMMMMMIGYFVGLRLLTDGC